jgi:hypothetical protein
MGKNQLYAVSEAAHRTCVPTSTDVVEIPLRESLPSSSLQNGQKRLTGTSTACKVIHGSSGATPLVRK